MFAVSAIDVKIVTQYFGFR